MKNSKNTIQHEDNVLQELLADKNFDEDFSAALQQQEEEPTQSQSEQGLSASNFLSSLEGKNEREFDLDEIEEVLQFKRQAIYYYGQHKYLEALSSLEQAIKIVPGDLELLFFEAQCLFQLKNLDQSEILLKQLVDLDEDERLKQLPKLYALILLKKKKFAQAEDFLQQQLPAQNIHADLQLLNMLGYALERQDKLQEAEKIFKKVIKEDPENANACNSLAYIFARLEIELGEALLLVNRAIKKEPRNPAYLDTLAFIYFKKGNPSAAAKTYKAALAFDPGNSEIMAHLSATLAI